MYKDSFKKLYQLLNRGEKKLFLLSWLLMFMSGIMQVFGIVSIMPFISVITNTDLIYNNEYLNWFYTTFNFDSELNFLIFLGAAVIGITVFANGTIALTRYVEAKFLTKVGVKVQSHLLEQYLFKPYTFFLKRNTSGLVKTLLAETNEVINGLLIPGVEMINNLMISLMILILLIAVDPFLAIVSVSTLGLLFSVIFYFIRKRLRSIGIKRVEANGWRFKSAQEALSGIKDIKLMGKEYAYLHYFTKHVKAVLSLNEKARMYQQIPPILMEIVILTGIMSLLLYFIVTRGGLVEALPSITLFAFAAYRLKPSIHNVFQKWSSIKYSFAALESVINDIYEEEEGNIKSIRSEKRLPLNHNLVVKNLSFKYPNSNQLILKNINLTIKANTTVAFVGPTGSGKTTLIDIILGLLKHESGEVRVNNALLSSQNIRQWQNNIGYIPQHIYLTDDTAASNIAFGISEHLIDMDRVKNAAKAAHLHEFICSLPEGYSTKVGERGVRLSGGQIQRVGIARALYHNPDILVMDEATSALDNLTERSVINAINSLAGSKTIIMIAHRLTTVKNCDIIYLLENGEIVDRGKYDDLIQKNAYFQDLATSH
jgi:ABC-type multidrug transport system fused ATPase/permease subunit